MLSPFIWVISPTFAKLFSKRNELGSSQTANYYCQLLLPLLLPLKIRAFPAGRSGSGALLIRPQALGAAGAEVPDQAGIRDAP